MKSFSKLTISIYLVALFTMILLQPSAGRSEENPDGGDVQSSKNVEHREILIHDQIDVVDLYLDERSVLCTSADYSALMLKINIPELRHLTVLDHTNTGTGLPCVQGGLCTETNAPEAIIELGPYVSAPIHVRRMILATIDHVKKTCSQDLKEIVDVDIKGKRFFHEAFEAVGNLPYNSCLNL